MAFFKGIASKLANVREKWSEGVASLFSGKLDDEFWEELTDRLIAGDVGVELSEELAEELKETSRREGIREPEALLIRFKEILSSRLESVPMMGKPLSPGSGLSIVVMVGVNGSGKTTTTGKLAQQLVSQGNKVVLAAADTFRAAASEQLHVWGERIGIRVISQHQGSDAGAVAYDAINAAKASGADVVIVDTAGRLQAKHNLMEELRKVYRVITKEVPAERIESLLVLDAVMGQNAFRQAEVFNEVTPLTGVVLAKYDNTAKGGIVLAIADKLKLPIRYVGLGEAIEDLAPFVPSEFVDALLRSSDRSGEE
ncbi:signal recognition particle-docking protein FtsY [Dethiosulfovibrio peptidovorans DSM 11002]|uniref:Signal recognition particle receptor FtsY n=1 Tax=Dethiosulfovibrio peptidovorans DSM 11002 TaxID=469381 RepID=D2Z448_9BACT|nr:signal recognition particle-docking protein FtsY [Dethiosulfovibrio peptidovorans]EFC92309.1 signal recognition particle-docking protein FtsY [Dethiosulfovibrio peptidovorans DSM 11002]